MFKCFYTSKHIFFYLKLNFKLILRPKYLYIYKPKKFLPKISGNSVLCSTITVNNATDLNFFTTFKQSYFCLKI